MKLFKCQNCGQVLYFENRQCLRCLSALGYLPGEGLMALRPTVSRDAWEIHDRPGQSFRRCKNSEWDACNWLVPGRSDSAFCAACRHNRTIPDLSITENLVNWRLCEIAKHRLFFTLIELGVPLRNRAEDPQNGLAFDFLAETPEQPIVITGHENGVITLNLKEADDSHRAKERLCLGEPCRTLLGHLRHESGHYFWGRLVTGEKRERFRQMFGDERVDYGFALQNYYARGPEPGWQATFISGYASSHPWEDFAETWAHYLHIADTMEMAYFYGTKIAPRVQRGSEIGITAASAPLSMSGFRHFVEEWRSLTLFMNSLNRCMGAADIYPFALSPQVISKLGFIHLLVAPAKVDSEPLSLTA